MKQIEDGQPNEVGPRQNNKDQSNKEQNNKDQSNKQQNNQEIPTFDDIYVPGIGTRAALDDDSPAGPGFLSELAERRIRAAAFLNRRAVWTIQNVRGARTRLASMLRTAGAEIRAAAQRPRFQGRLTSASGRTLKQMHSRFLNAAGKADARFRTTTRRLSVSTELAARAASQKLLTVGTRSLRVMRSASVPVHSSSKYKLSLPSIPPLPAAIGQNLRRAQSSVRSALAGAANRLRPAADYKAFRFYATYRLDPPMLRRAVLPLAMLAVIVMFAIEQIATVR